jgi:hypothetical protein
MRITKCDFCRREIKGTPIIAGNGYLKSVELCEKCGLPIMRFLNKNKFIDKISKIKEKVKKL